MRKISRVRSCDYATSWEADVRFLIRRHPCPRRYNPSSSPPMLASTLYGPSFNTSSMRGSVPETTYLFMARSSYHTSQGDFVDRSRCSLETMSLPQVLEARQVVLLRGNHEIYGFYDEYQQKYGSAAVWKAFCNVFDCLNVAAIIDEETQCTHGGLSPDIRTLNHICVLSRAQGIPRECTFCSFMWSDPDDIDNWAVNPSGAGWLFGRNVTREFNHVNSISLEGYKYMFDNALVTVWSAANYCYRCGNMASVLPLREGVEHGFKVFGPAPENERDKGMGRPNISRSLRS
ncbi:Metallo-dependent phosphatase [Pisolithus tinctorius]|nr:Metallo-dependent phosphatase [Pisolithus tinctorius]